MQDIVECSCKAQSILSIKIREIFRQFEARDLFPGSVPISYQSQSIAVINTVQL